VPLRLALFYAAFFPTLGIYIPFLPSYLAGKGMTAEEIGYLLGAIQISRLIGNPLIARAADAWGEARLPVILLTLASLAGFALFLVIDGFGGLLLLCLALGLVFTAVGPLTDSLAVSAAAAGGFDYGRVRLWGSLTYVLAATLGGIAIAQYGSPLIMWLIVVGWVVTVGAAFLLPRLPRLHAGEAGMMSLLTDRGFLLMLATSATIQSSHALFYAFGTIHWLAAGYGEGMIGWLWALSVIAEIMLFWAGKNLLRRLKGPELFVMGAAAALIRWVLAGLGTGLPLL
jgi:MFS transporter, PPP family, 3-phenylpropionic acid transporter